jgi:hypothetical protein
MNGDLSTRAAMTRVVFLTLTLAFVIGLIIWMQRRADVASETPAAPSAPTHRVAWESLLVGSALAPPPEEAGAAPQQRTLRDRARRDEVRSAIYKAHGRTPPPAASPPAASPPAAGAARHAPLGPDAGSLSPEYIQSRIRQDFVPMARQCYEAALEKNPKLGGKLVFQFVIVGDESVGGIVESADLDEKSTLKDLELAVCLRESLLSVSFEPPEGGGSVSVTYPFEFSPEGDGG